MRKSALFYLMAAMAVFVACGEEEDLVQNYQNFKFDVKNSEIVSKPIEIPSSVSLEKEITFTTTGPWSATVTDKTVSIKADNEQSDSEQSSIEPAPAASISWLSVIPDHGDTAGEYTIKILLDANTSTQSRSADIRITCGTETLPLTLKQFGKGQGPVIPTPKGTVIIEQGYNYRNLGEAFFKVTLLQDGLKLVICEDEWGEYGVYEGKGYVVEFELLCDPTTALPYEDKSTPSSGTLRPAVGNYPYNNCGQGNALPFSYLPHVYYIDSSIPENSETENRRKSYCVYGVNDDNATEVSKATVGYADNGDITISWEGKILDESVMWNNNSGVDEYKEPTIDDFENLKLSYTGKFEVGLHSGIWVRIDTVKTNGIGSVEGAPAGTYYCFRGATYGYYDNIQNRQGNEISMAFAINGQNLPAGNYRMSKTPGVYSMTYTNVNTHLNRNDIYKVLDVIASVSYPVDNEIKILFEGKAQNINNEYDVQGFSIDYDGPIDPSKPIIKEAIKPTDVKLSNMQRLDASDPNSENSGYYYYGITMTTGTVINSINSHGTYVGPSGTGYILNLGLYPTVDQLESYPREGKSDCMKPVGTFNSYFNDEEGSSTVNVRLMHLKDGKYDEKGIYDCHTTVTVSYPTNTTIKVVCKGFIKDNAGARRECEFIYEGAYYIDWPLEPKPDGPDQV